MKKQAVQLILLAIILVINTLLTIQPIQSLSIAINKIKATTTTTPQNVQTNSNVNNAPWTQVNLNSSQSRFSTFDYRHDSFSLILREWSLSAIETSSLVLDSVGKQLLVLLHPFMKGSDQFEPSAHPTMTLMGAVNLEDGSYSTISQFMLPAELQENDYDTVMPTPVVDSKGNYFLVRKNITKGSNVLIKISPSWKWTTMYESDGVMDIMHGLLIFERYGESSIVLSTSRNIISIDTITKTINFMIPSEQGYFGQLIRDSNSPYAFASIYGGLIKFELETGIVVTQSRSGASLVPYHLSSLKTRMLALSQFRTLDGFMVFATTFDKNNLTSSSLSIGLTDKASVCSNAIATVGDEFVILCRTKSSNYQLFGLKSKAEDIERTWTLNINSEGAVSQQCSLQISVVDTNSRFVSVVCDQSILLVETSKGKIFQQVNIEDQGSIDEDTQIVAAQNNKLYILREKVPRIDAIKIGL
ncbi:predicted protein [Naegleria gruberi]|uniref:Predicted protein n=1 Tax=Naegleria gruberi TaxID=5762 RepID=D2VE77_NAEGR|nr:uncharacterized protein NAEGRDRAFT_79622 [Naegleria gruberi]EFC44833.1 predicted protein [Naegleria gruberi]|eukprot:XP_002677577.1 predicted protein [Naegleria gruberi strain NEG-M]